MRAVAPPITHKDQFSHRRVHHSMTALLNARRQLILSLPAGNRRRSWEFH
jgi:hypothetical protein